MTAAFADLDLAHIVEASRLPRGPADFRVTLPAGFQEGRLFALLFSKVGPPNGPLTFFGKMAGGPPQGDPDGPFKWDFLVEFEKGPVVQFIRTWLSLEMVIWGRPIPASDEEALRVLEGGIKLHAQVIDQALSTLEEAILVINPYVRQKRIAELAESELLKTSCERPFYPKAMVATKEEMEKHNQSFSAFLDNACKSTFNAVVLVTASAFMAEAFLNLLLAAFPAAPLTTNPKLLEKALREPWRDKLASLPLHCAAIKRHPDTGDVRLRNAGTLFNLRNRIAHSYPDPDALGIGTMWFHRSVSILPSNQPFDCMQAGADLLLPTKDEALASKGHAEEFVEYVGSLLEDEFAPVFRFFSESNPIAWIRTTGRYAVPFGQTILKAFGQR